MKMNVLALVLALAVKVTASALAGDEAAAWERLQKDATGLTEGLPEDEAAGLERLRERLALQGSSFREYLASYPQSPHRWEARMAVMQIGNSLAMLEDREPDLVAQTAELRSIAGDEEAPDHIRADAGLGLLQITSLDFDEKRSEESARRLHDAIEAFLATHPEDPRRAALRLTAAQAMELFDLAGARTIFEEVAGDCDPEIAQAATNALELMALRNEPLELSFTAVDGRKIDMQDLRGQVVLLDFWATWCPPCVEEAPALVAAYEKFRERGFEIIGISLDTNKTALESFTAGRDMTWPQFFDGQGWENTLAQRFKIQSVPTMWLFGRDGKLADPAPRRRLEQAIEEALARP
jgi:thiol-disulfide isomerase/thioredoxin